MAIQSSDIKRITREMGIDLCGIASVDRFEEAPKGYHPVDVLPECKSVIVIAKQFLASSLQSNSTIPYSIVRNKLSEKMDHISLDLCYILQEKGLIAVPVGAVGPCKWDSGTNKSRGLISLKHAAVQAGLGKIGKNTLLINEKYGNMIWLNAVLVSAALEPDPIASYEGCIPGCSLCLDSCPVKAMDGVSMDQKKCWDYAFVDFGGDQVLINCYNCRKICPRCLGI